jgi:hypothetical protein
MGLGLPIVKRTVFDHNGRVDMTRTHGTSVSVLLPRRSNGICVGRGFLDFDWRAARKPLAFGSAELGINHLS